MAGYGVSGVSRRYGGIASPTQSSARTYRRDIDGLRAVAILGVLAYHFRLGGVTGGYGGVDVFFVISGFLIAGIIKSELDAGSFSIAGFYVRRIRRILPALTVCALTTTIFAALVLFPSDFKAFGKSLRGVATSTSNYYFMRQAADYFGGGSAENPTLHTWSLSVEEQFYVVLPLLLLVLFRFGRRGTLPVMGFFAVASLLFSIRGVEFTPQQAFFSTPGRAWELLIGALLAFGAIPHITGRPLREIAAVIGALMIALGYFFYTAATPFPGLAALPFCLGAVLIIHSGNASPPTATARLLSSPPAVWLGLISYSVYLWHWPVLALSRYRFPESLGADAPHKVYVEIILACASLALGFLSWQFVEKPFRHIRTASSRTSVFAGGLPALVAMAAISYAIIMRPNWFQRWSPDIDAMTATGRNLQPAAAFGPPVTSSVGLGPAAYQMGSGDTSIDTVLWGDSHALALLPGLDAYLKKSGRRVIVAPHPDCPPLLTVLFYDSGAGASCRGLNNATIAIAFGADIKRVILAARWAAIADNVRSDNEGKAVLGRGRGGDEGAVFSAVLEATVRRIVEHGKEVVIIGPVPEQQFDVSTAVARHVAWGQPLPREPTLSAFLLRQDHVLPVLVRLARLPNVRVVYPHLYLCSADTCHYEKNGEPLYLDRDHLAHWGPQS